MFRWSFLLLPFSLIYGLITYARNWLYKIGFFKRYIIPNKAIVVGNLSMGGTGKTPHVYFIANKLSQKYKIAILSRGYGRNTKGYIEVSEKSKANTVGDEPLLLKCRLQSVDVVVSESRKEGVKKLNDKLNPEVIVLDDAYQHLKVKAGLSILLTEFNKPFYKDYPIPMGRLREFRVGQNRANIIIVTKCPNSLSEIEKNNFCNKIIVSPEKIFFSRIVYSSFKLFSNKQVDEIKSIFLVTAIADDTKIVEYLTKSFSVKTYKFRDHHTFTEEDITKIHLKFEALPVDSSIILTTEKDFVKLKEFNSVKYNNYPWYYLPIDIEIDRENEFNKLIEDYVGKV